MELFTRFFNIEIPLVDIRKRCPFVNRLSEEYMNCFHCVYDIKEFDWVRYISEHNIALLDEISAYDEWMKSDRNNAYVIGSNEIYSGFPWEDYLHNNTELTEREITSELEIYEHWAKYGRKENRVVVNPTNGILKNKLLRNTFIEKILRECITSKEERKVDEFDWKRYINAYADLRAITSEKSAYYHWVIHGRSEKRTAFVLNTNEPYIGFPWKEYVEHNPDISHIKTELQAYDHWMNEGRNTRFVYKVIYIEKPPPYFVFIDKTLNRTLELIIKNMSNHKQNPLLWLNLELNKENILDRVTHQTNTNIFDFSHQFNFNPTSFARINKNIDIFSNIIQKYKNIVFICSDYPGYGGAATNCNDLSTYYSKTHNVHSVYWTHSKDSSVKYEMCESYSTTHASQLSYTLRNLAIKPDLVILKSAICLNVKDIWDVPVFFLIPGLYTNALNKSYNELNTLTEQNKYINHNVLNQIRTSNGAFCNSLHTQQILRQCYNINTHIFCSSFIKYYGQSVSQDTEFENRKYDYGLIISNFNRNIKNAKQSLLYLKDKKKVLLIGKGSSKYKSEYCETIEHVKPEDMGGYYKQIKYIRQDSFYESCSNVLVEGLFNGCKTELFIVVSSTQYPGYGGAATNAYEIIKYLRHNGYNVAGAFFHTTLDVCYDPENIGGIFMYSSSKYDVNQIKSDVKSYLKSDPNYCLGKNYKAPYICKLIFNCYTVYLVSGINHFRAYYPTTSAMEMLDDSFHIGKIVDEEVKMNRICDSIVVNSALTHKIFAKIYPEFVNKLKPPLDTTFCIYRSPTIYEKEYDIILICSNFERESKNYKYLLDILSTEHFEKYNKIIIGENSKLFETVKNSRCLPLQPHKTAIMYMAKSKLMLHPALYESNSNTIREAYYHKCLPIITRNVGYNELFPECLICDNFTTIEWSNKINYVLKNYEQIKDINIDFNTTLDLNKLICFS